MRGDEAGDAEAGYGDHEDGDKDDDDTVLDEFPTNEDQYLAYEYNMDDSANCSERGG